MYKEIFKLAIFLKIPIVMNEELTLLIAISEKSIIARKTDNTMLY